MYQGLLHLLRCAGMDCRTLAAEILIWRTRIHQSVLVVYVGVLSARRKNTAEDHQSRLMLELLVPVELR
jgi:hypothetical protein